MHLHVCPPSSYGTAGDANDCYTHLVVCVLSTTVSPAKTAKPIEMPFGKQTCVGPRKCHVLDGGYTLAPPGGTSERPVRGGVAASSRITLTAVVAFCRQYKDGRREGVAAAEVRRRPAGVHHTKVAQRRRHPRVVGRRRHDERAGRTGVREAVQWQTAAVRRAELPLPRGGVERRDAGPTPRQRPVVGRRQPHVPPRQPRDHQRLLTRRTVMFPRLRGVIWGGLKSP